MPEKQSLNVTWHQLPMQMDKASNQEETVKASRNFTKSFSYLPKAT